MARRKPTKPGAPKSARTPKRPRNPVARALFSPALKPKAVTTKGPKGIYPRKGRRPPADGGGNGAAG